MLILPTTYLGPENWYRALLHADETRVEVMESFLKQTYRNRCTILTPDGPLTLSVPLKKVERKQFTRDIEISYQAKWQHQHWMAILSAYKHTPYFDYYQDFFKPFYEHETKYLIDFNDGLHEVIMSLLSNEAPQSGGTKFLIPKTADWMGLNLEDRWGDGISILDKLFRFGPEAKPML